MKEEKARTSEKNQISKENAYKIRRDQVRTTCLCTLRLRADGRSVALTLPYIKKEKDETIEALEMKEGVYPVATLLVATGIPQFILDLCFHEPLTLDDIAIFNEMIYEFYGLSDFDMNRWERQARMLEIDNFSDLATVFDSSMMLHDFPDLHDKKDVIHHLCTLTGTRKMAPYMERFQFLDTKTGMLMYTVGDQEMIALMERKKMS